MKILELAQEIRPMHSCAPMKLMNSGILEATPKEAKESTPKTTPATVKERLAIKTPHRMALTTYHGLMMDRFRC